MMVVKVGKDRRYTKRKTNVSSILQPVERRTDGDVFTAIRKFTVSAVIVRWVLVTHEGTVVCDFVLFSQQHKTHAEPLEGPSVVRLPLTP